MLFLFSLFFRFFMLPRATRQALSFSSFPVAVCLVFRTSLTGMLSLSLQNSCPAMKVSWSIKVFISMLIACSQVNWMSSLSLRTALKDCGSGRFLSIESSMEEWDDEEAVASMVSIAV